MLSDRDIKYQSKLRSLKASFDKGQVLDRSDLSAHGFKRSSGEEAIRKLKTHYEMDILTITRGKAMIGWILASEVL